MEFSFNDLLKRFWKFTWLIALLIVVFAGAGFMYSKAGKTTTNFDATRSVLIAKNNTNVKDPNSRFMADKSLIPTYQKVATDDAVVEAVQKDLPFKMTKSDIAAGISIHSETDTLILDFQATGENTYRAKTLANTYAKDFSEVGPTIYPDMQKPDLLSAVTSTGTINSAARSTKKLTVFGAVLGLVLALFVVLVTGIQENYRAAKKQG
ncbi:Wzz/FepE/Etk N-terminal domain-containing protein [Fructobacillus ficulneus]|uniref:Capsular polysaccharide biosynthesis protein n=1 Tax=Fructobacillus ficulneus TaxID=157463 RepID=A0A0K8MEZ7_9LACO|nr:Wzz/FepE/Etk N-terminal domain-containing protein [Fructobacillus ficulneus]GAO99106.1 capsular polysaccharide biosynthesis protein [Fructobacillus ficulneus]